MIFENGYHQLYNDLNADIMFDYIKTWMSRDDKKNNVVWNSAKVSGIKSDLLKQKDYVKKIVLILIGVLIVLIGLIRKFKKCIKGCTSI